MRCLPPIAHRSAVAIHDLSSLSLRPEDLPHVLTKVGMHNERAYLIALFTLAGLPR
jgi:hypothetical protein